jgi:tetratricopeptide (TPR) repeat protein
MGLSKTISLTGALLFGLHPAQSEVVNYVSARSESLAALFYLASFALYASASSRRAMRHPSRVLYTGSLLAFALALLSKAVALTLPLMLLFYCWCRCDRDHGRERSLARAFPGLLPYWIVAGAYAILYRGILVQTGQGLYEVRDPLSQVATQCKAIVHYLKLAMLPVTMSVQPQFSESVGLLDGPAWSACLVGASLVVGSVALRRWNSMVFFGTIWFFVALLPVLTIPLNVLVNDHRLYLALLGPVIALSSLLDRAPGRWLVFCLAGLFAILTHQRDGVWRDEISLWSDAARRGPAMPAAHYNLAYALHQDGELERAALSYQAATRLDPSYVRAHVNLGALYRQAGATAKALEALQRAVELDPYSAEALNNLGLAHADGGDFDLAVSAYEEALSLDGEMAEVWLNLGLAYRGKGLLDRAFQCLSQAIQLDPAMKDRYPAGR